MLSRENIRQVDCPTCNAAKGQKCVYSGKGALKAMRIGKNHFARMQLAQATLEDEGLIE